MKSISFMGRSIPVAPLCLIFLASSLWPEMELLVPSLPAMKVAFGVTDGEIQQLLTANFVGFLCGVLLAGALCDSWGRKKTILWGMALYLCASAFAIWAGDFSLLMGARFMQGLAVTAPIVAGSALLMDLTAGPGQIAWISFSTAMITICMAVAPLVGAWINVRFGFQGNLWAIFLMGLFGVIPMLAVPETLPPEKRKALRLRPLILGYSAIIRNTRFMTLSVAMCVLAAAYWIYSGVSALYMVDFLHMDQALFGNYQAPIVGAFACFSLCINWFYKRWGLFPCLKAGIFSMCLGTVTLLTLALVGIEDARLTTIFMMCFVAGMVPVNSLLIPSAINQLPVDLQGSGQSMIQGLRLFIASLGTGLLGIVYQGPFLPVAMILFTAFACGSFLIWIGRSYIEDSPDNNQVIGGGH